MSFIRTSKACLAISTLLIVASIVLLIVPGPLLSIDFTGGTLMEILPPEGKTKQDVDAALRQYPGQPPLGNVSIAQTKSGGMFLRMRDLSNEEHQALITHLEQELGDVDEHQFTTIGPTVGASLKERAVWALFLAAIAIVLYVAFAFRKIPRKQSPLKFGVVAVLTLLHDVLITVGIFILIAQVTSFEFDTLFITALLTIMGYSVNDTIVIFDRIRDNLSLQERNEDFAVVAERSIRQSLTRSFNTSFSTLIMLIALVVFGSESIRWFVLALTVGIGIGTYSSLFISPLLLVLWRKKG